MEKETVLDIAKKYRNMSHNYSSYGEDQCAQFEQYAEIIEEEINLFVEDDYYETEKDVLEFAKEIYRMAIDH